LLLINLVWFLSGAWLRRAAAQFRHRAISISMENDQRRIKVGGICGTIGSLTYLGLALSDPYIGPQTRTTQEFLAAWGTPRYVALNMALHFLFAGAALLWLIAFVGLKRLLGGGNLVIVGTILGIIACAVMVQMMIVQGSVMTKMSQLFLLATNDSERQSALTLYKSLRFIDYGMDLTFDLCLFTGWILIAIKMWGHDSFGKTFAVIGIALFTLALVFNLRAAPDPPSFDIGPIAALWVLAVYIQIVRAARRFRNSKPAV
jgi:hypothetical protein